MRSTDPTLRPFSVAIRLKSFRYAARGIGTLMRSQHNAWLHLAATVAVLIGGFVLRITRMDWFAIIGAIGAVWTAEALNTAFELLCDVTSPEFHPVVEKSKDVAAGAVLVCALSAAILGVLVFGPPLLALGGWD